MLLHKHTACINTLPATQFSTVENEVTIQCKVEIAKFIIYY